MGRPRGLITVLLFLHVREAFSLPSYLNGSVILVVLISSALILVASFQVSRQVLASPDTLPSAAPDDEVIAATGDEAIADARERA